MSDYEEIGQLDKTVDENDLEKRDNSNKSVRKPRPTFLSGLSEMMYGSYLNVLLVCVPISFVWGSMGWSETVTFFSAILALAPLAERLGFVTEQLSIHTNETIGGLLNATFGNATEMLVAVIALYKGLFRLVQLSLLGSILSNLLLVLGTSFFVGGLKYKTQYFKRLSSQVNSTLLMLSAMAVLFPGLICASTNISEHGELVFSRVTSVIMLLMYGAFLFFQVKTLNVIKSYIIIIFLAGVSSITV
jgi:Ca2+:H+ antiporter